MDKRTWTKPNLVSLTAASDSEGGKYFATTFENSVYDPSGVQDT